jgi:hypothetical protein
VGFDCEHLSLLPKDIINNSFAPIFARGLAGIDSCYSRILEEEIL